ncbi:NUDIX domain-containing protein [Candidatus Saccharibacteria bacterium]|nr:NUDIX domain-containing protein [Candidatus Saccharibacteria bacterium]
MPNWQKVFSGKIWQIQQKHLPDSRIFERAIRAPGSRIIVVRNGKILLQREKRHELAGKTDIRLPGGKVFDTLEDFEAFQGDIVEASRQSISQELLEEAGIVVNSENLNYLGVDFLGATVSWDLHYWIADNVEISQIGAKYHESEDLEIEGNFWADFDEVRKIVLDEDTFSESRSAIALLRFINESEAK